MALSIALRSTATGTHSPPASSSGSMRERMRAKHASESVVPCTQWYTCSGHAR